MAARLPTAPRRKWRGFVLGQGHEDCNFEDCGFEAADGLFLAPPVYPSFTRSPLIAVAGGGFDAIAFAAAVVDRCELAARIGKDGAATDIHVLGM